MTNAVTWTAGSLAVTTLEESFYSLYVRPIEMLLRKAGIAGKGLQWFELRLWKDVVWFTFEVVFHVLFRICWVF